MLHFSKVYFDRIESLYIDIENIPMQSLHTYLRHRQIIDPIIALPAQFVRHIQHYAKFQILKKILFIFKPLN